MAQLIVAFGDKRRVLDLSTERATVIGRGREVDLQLDDPSLSRKHCVVRREGTDWLVKDLGSVNGTFCNNHSITEHVLRPGDRIQIGPAVLTFALPEPDQQVAVVHQVPPDAATSTEVDQHVARRLRSYLALLEITKAVNSVLSREALLELVIDKAIELTSAERGFLILLESGEPVFRVARTKAGTAISDPEKQISRSVVQRVAQSGEPVLTLDAQNDLGKMSDTIAALDVRSLLCAPLKAKDRVLGCVYVDSSFSELEFNEEALGLLQAFADQAAIAMENARLYDEANASREQERRVRQLFQKYVPADVVRRALEMPDAGKMSTKQTATVLFSDIRSFTSISEKMEPEEVVEFLNDYLQRMVDIVFDEGGIVDKFIGDAVMAVFGAPFPKPDDALRAVRAAHRMMVELDRFNAEQAQKGGVQIRIGIGLHTGPLFAGNIGSDRKMEYTVIGDTVNIASRVQDLTKEFKTEVIITHGCWEATRRRVPVKQLPPVTVKGKELPLQVYELVRQQPAGARPVHAPGAVSAPTQAVPAARPGPSGGHAAANAATGLDGSTVWRPVTKPRA